LGFLQVTATNNVTATDPGSEFKGTFTADFTGAAANGRLLFSDLNNLKTDPRLQADAALKFKVSTALNPELGINNGIIPSIGLDLNLLNWNYDSNPDAADQRAETGALALAAADTTSGAPTVDFTNVSLDLGSFFSKFAGSILEDVQSVASPITKTVNQVSQPLPLIGSLKKIAKLLIDAGEVGGKFANVDEFIEQFDEIASVLSAVQSADTKGLAIDLGDFKLPGDVRELDVTQGGVEPLQTRTAARPRDQALAQGISTEFFDLRQNSENKLSDNLKFPILEDPSLAVRLLLGQNVDLFTYETPKLELGIDKEFEIRIFGPVVLILGGKAGVSAQLKFGFDTKGFQDFKGSQFTNPDSIFDGFYVSSPGENPDPPGTFSEDSSKNLLVGGEVTGKVGVSLGFASVSAGGGLGLTIGMDVANKQLSETDPEYFKVRGSTIATTSNPLCLFDAKGALSFVVYAAIRLKFGFFKITKRFNLAEVNLVDFNLNAGDCSKQVEDFFNVKNPDPELVKKLKDQGIIDRQGTDENDTITLTLQGVLTQAVIDQREKDRETDKNFDKTLPKLDRELFDGKVLLKGLPDPVDYDNVQIVVINSGKGNDTVTMIGLISSGQLDGEEGDDTLTGGNGDDFLTGGSGNDTLDGGVNGINTAIYSDSPLGIYVNLTPDQNGFGYAYDGFVDGNRLPYVDRLTRIQSVEGSNYDDTIIGDTLDNNLLGMGGSDHLFGGLGNDVLLGGSGGRGDYMDGGEGIDTTTYLDSLSGVQVNLSSQKITVTSPIDGRSTVVLAANSGQQGDASGDRLFNIENLHGSTRDDILVGSDLGGNIDGFWGDDIILAGAGAEELNGNRGIDWLSYQDSKTGVQVSLAPLGSGGLFFPSDASGGFAQGDRISPAVALNKDGEEIFDENGKGTFVDKSSFENLEGSKSDDPLLEGDREANIIKGLLGIDSLSGLEGDDTLIGGGGADVLDGGENNDGRDTNGDGKPDVPGLQADSNELYQGGDTASYEGSPTGVEVNLFANIGRFGDAEGDTFRSVENLLGSAYSDKLTGNDFNNDINPGLRGPDSVGGSILDTVDGGGGRDRLTVDYLTQDYSEYGGVTGGFTGESNEGSLIRSGSRPGLNDEIRFSNIERLYIIGTSKRDEVYGGTDDDIFYTGAGDDFVNAGGGNDDINVDDGNDTVDAGDGDDTIDAGEGNDELRGNRGGDSLIGGGGDDILVGTDSLQEKELDILTGGTGADKFVLGDMKSGFYRDTPVFNPSGNGDSIDSGFAVITDFNSDEDLIVLHGADNRFQGDYYLRQIGSDLSASIIGIFSGKEGVSAKEDLIATVQGSSITLTASNTITGLTESYFRVVGDQSEPVPITK
jgi:Ca2+-binding RTX toxin-like protein